MPFYANDLYPLGFSKDSYFAYIQKYNTDALNFWRLFVINMVTDEVEVELLWDSDETFWDLCDGCSFEKLISLKKKEITRVISRYGITIAPYKLQKNSAIKIDGIHQNKI